MSSTNLCVNKKMKIVCRGLCLFILMSGLFRLSNATSLSHAHRHQHTHRRNSLDDGLSGDQRQSAPMRVSLPVSLPQPPRQLHQPPHQRRLQHFGRPSAHPEPNARGHQSDESAISVRLPANQRQSSVGVAPAQTPNFDPNNRRQPSSRLAPAAAPAPRQLLQPNTRAPTAHHHPLRHHQQQQQVRLRHPGHRAFTTKSPSATNYGATMGQSRPSTVLQPANAGSRARIGQPRKENSFQEAMRNSSPRDFYEIFNLPKNRQRNPPPAAASDALWSDDEDDDDEPNYDDDSIGEDDGDSESDRRNSFNRRHVQPAMRFQQDDANVNHLEPNRRNDNDDERSGSQRRNGQMTRNSEEETQINHIDNVSFRMRISFHLHSSPCRRRAGPKEQSEGTVCYELSRQINEFRGTEERTTGRLKFRLGRQLGITIRF